MDENKPLYYVNQTSLSMSCFDINMVMAFRTREAKTPDEAPSPEEVICTLVMSPQHAKAFANNLIGAVKAYEDVFGEINLTPNQEKLKSVVSRNGK